MLNLDLLADLPPPSDDEPPSLRSDIVDELLDHLQCAFRREVLKDGDEAAAEERVLDRFGDPKKLARRLWWQAVWSRVMGKRILSGLQWLVSLAAVVMAGMVLMQQTRILTEMNAHQAAEMNWRQTLSMTLNDLRSRLPAPAQPPETVGGMPGGGGMGGMSPMMASGVADIPGPAMPSLTVKLVQGTADGPPVTETLQDISLTNTQRTISGVPQGFAMGTMPGAGGGMPAMAGPMGYGGASASPDGQFVFDQLEPNRYELKITLADGQTSTQPILIRGEKPQTLTVICPGPRKKIPLQVTIKPLPADLQSQCRPGLSVSELPQTINGIEWSPSQIAAFDLPFEASTGWPWRIVQGATKSKQPGQVIDLSQQPESDRVVFVATGPLQAQFVIDYDVQLKSKEGSLATASKKIAGDPFTYIVKPGETRWEPELPESLLNQVRSRSDDAVDMVELKAGPARGFVGAKGGRGAKGAVSVRGKRALDEEPLGDNARLIVKLTSETKDGPAAKDASLVIRTEQGAEVASWLARGNIQFSDERQAWVATISPGRHSFSISFPDGRRLDERLPLMRPGQERELHIVCPPEVKQGTVLLKAPPVPNEFRNLRSKFRADFVRQPMELEGRRWHLTPTPNSYDVRHASFDPETGLVTQANGVDFTSDPPEDRILLLRTGVFRANYTLIQTIDGPETPVEKVGFQYPPLVPGEEPVDLKPYEFELKPGDNTWTLKLDDFWAAAKAAFDAEKPPQHDEPNAKTSPQGPTLTVKLVQDTEDGPPVMGARLTARAEDRVWGADAIREDAGAKSDEGDETGEHRFQFDHADRYELLIRLPDGQQEGRQAVALRDKEQKTLTVICPGMRKKIPVTIGLSPLPEDLRPFLREITLSLEHDGLRLEDTHWTLDAPPRYRMEFDPKTSQLTKVQQIFGNSVEKIDLAKEDADDRVVFLPTGVLLGRFHIQYTVNQKNKMLSSSDREIAVTVNSETKELQIEVPEEILAKLQKSLAPDDKDSSTTPTESGDKAPAKDDAKPATPPGDSPGAKTDSPKSADESKLTLIAHTQGKPTAGVQVTLYREDDINQRDKLPDQIGQGTTDEGGEVSFTDLPAGRIQASIYAPQVEMRTSILLSWGGGHERRMVPLPTSFRMTELKLATNLPQDLHDAGVRVCVRIGATPRPEPTGFAWRVSQEPFEALVIGKNGIEGRLELPRIRNHADGLAAFRQGRHRMEAAESTWKVPVIPLRVGSLDLICPAPKVVDDDADASQKSEWIVCAWPQPKPARSGDEFREDPEISFQPKSSDVNEWTLDVPEELIIVARSRLAKLKAEESSANGAVP